jgi:hypothetical protein
MSKQLDLRHNAPRSKLGVALVLTVILAMSIVVGVSETARFGFYSAVDVCLYGFPTARDESDAEAVRNIILLAHTFTKGSVSQPGRPPVFITVGSARLLTNPTVIHVYEVEDPSEQEKIVAAVQGIVTARQSKPVELRFYDHENWKVEDNVALRGPEKLLRRLKVK